MDIIILALAKAFDKVSHHRLLHKLSLYGVRDNSTMACIIFSTKGNSLFFLMEADVLSGVPHDTVLCSLLFLAFNNDLPKLHSTHTRGYLQILVFFTGKFRQAKTLPYFMMT